MTETEIREALTEVLFDGDAADDLDLRDALSFSEDGVLTSNEGLVLRMRDGSEFQLTIVKSR